MRRRRTIDGFVARETLLALLVLALAFLNFGHASVSAAGHVQVTPDVWCGDPLLPGSPDHSPCHACRIGGGANLSPAPLCIEPVIFATAPVAYAEAQLALGRAPLRLIASPRGPPVA